MVFSLPHCVSWVTGMAERSSTQKERKKKSPPLCVFSVAVNQLWSQELIDLFPLKIHQVEWDWRQSLGSVNMGPRWPGGIWTAPQVQWSERCVLWPRAPWKGLRLGRPARAKPPTHQRICASLCQDHGPATCQPLGWIHVLAGQWKISINHYPKPPIQWQKIPAVNVLSSWTSFQWWGGGRGASVLKWFLTSWV